MKIFWPYAKWPHFYCIIAPSVCLGPPATLSPDGWVLTLIPRPQPNGMNQSLRYTASAILTLTWVVLMPTHNDGTAGDITAAHF